MRWPRLTPPGQCDLYALTMKYTPPLLVLPDVAASSAQLLVGRDDVAVGVEVQVAVREDGTPEMLPWGFTILAT